MKRFFLLFIVSICLTASMTSCYTTEFVAPRGKEIRLAQDNEVLPFKKSHIKFWFFFGAVPINPGRVDEIILENDLNVVRFTTSQEPLNFLLNFLFNAAIPTTITTETITIEGSSEARW